MKNIISLVSKRENASKNEDKNISESSKNIVNQQEVFNTENFEEGKRIVPFELDHLEFTTNSAQLGDSDRDNENVINETNTTDESENEANSEEKARLKAQALLIYPKQPCGPY
ncbi:AEL_collapsed_G0006400.mRNA.1.CDS.1 [Saccharomyces cerevisiae]|nr:AEL_collapsed_G0006400.mRNA.1.CDS.1 [Saccharomyces cerevisiae]